MKTLDFEKMEYIAGGWSWGGCVDGMSRIFVTRVAAIAAWKVALAAGAVVCVAGGLGAFD